jgi:PAS domain S-box-containing protein
MSRPSDPARASLILANVGEAVIATDLSDVVTYWNEGAEGLFRCPAAAARGRPLAERAPGADVAGWLARLRAGGAAVAEWPVPSPDGRDVWVEARGRPAHDAEGRLVGVVLVALDVTGRRRAEEGRLAEERRLQEAQRLAGLATLAGGVAHELNNLLTAILGHAHLARAEAAPGAAVRPHLDEIDAASRRAADLCRQVRAYAGKGRFVVGPLDLNRVVAEAAVLLRPALPARAELELRPATLPAVQGDAAQLGQAVVNLVLNAAEALGDAPGRITVATAAEELGRAALAGLRLGAGLTPGRFAVLEVSDTGHGMDEATRARAFEPFFSTRFPGRGLGLSAVEGIVRGHGGALEVRSEPGRGATFRLYLPVAASAAPPTPAWTCSGAVLVIDDEGCGRWRRGCWGRRACRCSRPRTGGRGWRCCVATGRRCVWCCSTRRRRAWTGRPCWRSCARRVPACRWCY